MSLLASNLEEYCHRHSSQPSADCQAIADYTRAKVDMARMLIGGWQAGFLQLLIRLSNAKRVLEIGTFTGYSALAMAEALPDDGQLTTIDVNQQTTEIAKSFWQKSTAGHKITSLIKPALEVLAEMPETQFDLVFIDADKKNTRNYFDRSLAHLTPKGIIVIDNAFMDGGVLSSDSNDAEVRHMQEFNDYLAERADLHKSLISIRDGLFVVTR